MPADRSTSYHLDRLRAGIRPLRLHWFARLRSTNDHAALLRRRGELFAPALVLAGRQIAGRGRGTNRWFSTRGSITATFIFPIEEHLRPHQLPLVAGLAVRSAVAEHLPAGTEIGLKWPNDIVRDGRKLAGLLCERVERADLIGIGLNVNINQREIPRPLRGRICSMAEMADRPLDQTAVLISLARQLHDLLGPRGRQRQMPFSSFLREYDRHHTLLGRRLMILGASDDDPAVSGLCEGLDAHGRLLLRDRTTLHRVLAGQVVMEDA